MEYRDLAIRVLSADTMEEKLLQPQELTDNEPGPALVWDSPTRPPGMEFSRRSRKDKLPSFQEHADPDKRAICLHRFAGHELLAVEIMAYALLAFPEAPKQFRRGLMHTLRDEQRHVRMYCERLEGLGICFGDLPMYKHFWAHVPYLHDPVAYVSNMSLTFEMANLDFAPMYGASFDRVGDTESSDLMKQILRDEIAHVSFGWRWLKRLKREGCSEYQAWVDGLSPFNTPERAKGFLYHEEHRRKAGISDEWLDSYRTEVQPAAAQ